MSKKLNYGFIQGIDLKYEVRLVAFLDLLGFSRLVFERKEEDVEFLINLIPDMIRTHENNSLRNDLQVTHISDSIVLSITANKENKNLVDLFQLAVFIGRVQYELASNGYYMRGAITVGDCFHDSKNNILVGPAFIRAYTLEQKYAIVPRVIIDTEIETYFCVQNSEMISILSSDFIKDYYQGTPLGGSTEYPKLKVNKFFTFIDYISMASGRFESGFEDSTFKLLNNLKSALVTGAANEKYRWLSEYLLEVFKKQYESMPSEIKTEYDSIRKYLNNYVDPLYFKYGLHRLRWCLNSLFKL